MDNLFLLGRILYGGYFIMAGFNHFRHHKAMVGYAQSKRVPKAELLVPLTGLMLLAGGLGVVVGAQVLYALGLLVVFLLVVTFMMHDYWNETDPAMKMSSQVNFYKNLALLGAALALIAFPEPWPMSWLIN